MRSRFFPALAVLLSTAAAVAAEGPEASATAAVRSARDRLASAQIAGDQNAILDLCAEDAVIVPPGGEPITGRDAISDWLRTSNPAGSRPARLVFETQSLFVKGEIAVEVGQARAELASPGGPPTPLFDAYLAVWSRGPDGGWRISRVMWSPREAKGQAPPTPAPPPPSAANYVFPEASALPLPDPRSLSDGYVRGLADHLRSLVRRIDERPGDADSAAKAVQYLVKQIRDVGWIDIGRFGVAAACDAAAIVEKSGDRRLMETTLPWMQKGLKTSEGSACYDRVAAAYEKLRN